MKPGLTFTGLLILVSGALNSAYPEAPQSSDSVMLMAYRQGLRKDATSAEAAAKALVRLGPKAEELIPDLTAALRYDEAKTAEAVIQALAAIGPAAVPALSQSLEDSNFLVRARAAKALAAFGPQAARAAPALAELLADPSFEVRADAAKTLEGLGDAGVNAVSAALKHEQGANRRLYIDLLPKLGEKAVPALVWVLIKEDTAYLRAAAASSLRQMGPHAAPAVPALTQALSDLQEVVRGEAADALAAIGPAAEPAIKRLQNVSENDFDALVRQKAAQAIQAIHPAPSSKAR